MATSSRHAILGRMKLKKGNFEHRYLSCATDMLTIERAKCIADHNILKFLKDFR